MPHQGPHSRPAPHCGRSLATRTASHTMLADRIDEDRERITRCESMTDVQIPTTESIQLASAPAPYVLAIDIGSGSTRGCLYDAYARPIKKHLVKADHAFTEAADGTAEVDADQIVDEVAEVIDGALKGVDPGLVRAV